MGNTNITKNDDMSLLFCLLNWWNTPLFFFFFFFGRAISWILILIFCQFGFTLIVWGQMLMLWVVTYDTSNKLDCMASIMTISKHAIKERYTSSLQNSGNLSCTRKPLNLHHEGKTFYYFGYGTLWWRAHFLVFSLTPGKMKKDGKLQTMATREGYTSLKNNER